MFHHVYKYLILHEKVGLLGIGVFILDRESATPDIVNKAINPPLQSIRFKPNASITDKYFYQFLADEMNLDAFQVIKKFQDFCNSLRLDVQLNKWVELPGMGILTQGVRDEIKFKSSSILEEYYPAIYIDKIAQTESGNPYGALPNETIDDSNESTEDDVYIAQRKSSWWLYVLILALLSTAAIIYYYYTLKKP